MPTLYKVDAHGDLANYWNQHANIVEDNLYFIDHVKLDQKATVQIVNGRAAAKRNQCPAAPANYYEVHASDSPMLHDAKKN